MRLTMVSSIRPGSTVLSDSELDAINGGGCDACESSMGVVQELAVNRIAFVMSLIS